MLIGGLDVGTSGCKLTLYNEKGCFVNNSYKEYDITRADGTQEIDASVIFDTVCDVIKDTAQKYSDIAAIGVTTFGETFTVTDKDGNVLMPSMLYTDSRGGEEVKELTNALGEQKIIDIAGVKPHQMYSLPKLMWIKKNRPDIYKKTAHVLLMEDFIVYKLTGRTQIDYSLAARTMAFDIRKKEWSSEIFEAAGIDKSLMAEPVPTGSSAGEIKADLAEKLGLSAKTVIINGCHDQVAAAVGAGIFEVGSAVDGTGTCECITPVFDSVPASKKLYDEGYSVVPFVFDGTYVCYLLSFTGGAVLKWYRDNLAKYEAEQAKLKNENVYAVLDSCIPDKPTDILILPHFSGAANPYMDTGSKAVIAGLTLEHTKYDIYKALMEGITYEMLNNIDHVEAAGISPEKLTATGGGAASKVWLQIKADIFNRPVTSLDALEAGSCGTCMLAAVAVGVFKDLYEAKAAFVHEKKTYYPNEERAAQYKKKYEAYKKLYSAVRPIIGEACDE